MINQKFVDKQRVAIEKNIEKLTSQINARKGYKDIGSSNEDNALEFEAFEEGLALDKTASKELKQLKAALGRIENGTYGVCLKCRGPIEAGRLETYPEAEYCAVHAKG